MSSDFIVLQLHVGHCVAGEGGLWVLEPRPHIVRGVGQKARDDGALGHMIERRPDMPFGAGNAGNLVARSAAGLGDQLCAALGVTDRHGRDGALPTIAACET